MIAGLARVLQYLPRNHPDRPRFERQFSDMAAKVLSCQQADGLWRASLLDPASYPLRETSGSGFFTYALAWGVNQGILDPGKYAPAVRRAWDALVGCVEPDGKLAHVQPIGADPKRFSEDSTEVYGVGAFLLAGSEVYRLCVLEGMAAAGTHALVAVGNPAGFHRQEETVQVDPASLGFKGGIAVMDGVSSRILDSQAYASEPGQAPDRLLFQVDLAPGETRLFYVMDARSLAAVPQPIVKTYVRQIAERFNDLAWESDRIAHRMYSQDLIKGEGTISSGIDVWAKRTRARVIDEWYKRTNYHEDDGDGLDDYQVGRSRGCGGLGVWHDGKLFASINFRSARIITTGPIRSEFELSYDAWDAGGRRVAEKKRISIDAGSNLSRAESVFTSSDPSPIQVAIGIAQRPGGGADATKDRDAGWMTYWQAPDRDRGSIGCAVVLPKGGIEDFVMETASVPQLPADKRMAPGSEGLHPAGNLLALTPAEMNTPLVYYFGAGWSRSGDFQDAAAWARYVGHFAERLEALAQWCRSRRPPRRTDGSGRGARPNGSPNPGGRRHSAAWTLHVRQAELPGRCVRRAPPNITFDSASLIPRAPGGPGRAHRRHGQGPPSRPGLRARPAGPRALVFVQRDLGDRHGAGDDRGRKGRGGAARRGQHPVDGRPRGGIRGPYRLV